MFSLCSISMGTQNGSPGLPLDIRSWRGWGWRKAAVREKHPGYWPVAIGAIGLLSSPAVRSRPIGVREGYGFEIGLSAWLGQGRPTRRPFCWCNGCGWGLTLVFNKPDERHPIAGNEV